MKTISNQTNKIFQTVVLVAMVFIGQVVMSQEKAAAQGKFQFESQVIDYGTIDKGSDGVRTFTFTNTGNAPIVITEVKTSCGCTVPTKPEKAIMPGETAEIGVKYDTSRVGVFTKSLTVVSNAVVGRTILKIKGVVSDTSAKSDL